MSLPKPYHRNWRAIKPGANSGFSSWAYIIDKEYAQSPTHYVRAYEIIQADLERLFEYIEPSPESLQTFSYRIHELLMRTCIELEANFKAILTENIYTPQRDRFGNPIYNTSAYKKVDVTHHLSSYEVSLPAWNGPPRIIKPFADWRRSQGLSWYQAYNASKHDRHDEFKRRTWKIFCQLLRACSSCFPLSFARKIFLRDQGAWRSAMNITTWMPLSVHYSE